MEAQETYASYNDDLSNIFLKTNSGVLTGSISNYSAKFFVLKINENITLKELDKYFLHFEHSLDRCVRVVVRGRVKQSLGENLFLFEVGQLDYFQKENFIGSNQIVHPIVSFYDENNLSYAGLLKEMSAYEVALSVRTIPKNLSVGQIFIGVNFQLGISENLSVELFLKKITSDRESYILLFQISGECRRWIQMTSMLSVFSHRDLLSPIFYNKNTLEKWNENIFPPTLDKLSEAHKRLALGLLEESDFPTCGGESFHRSENMLLSTGNPLDAHWFRLSQSLFQETNAFTFKKFMMDHRRNRPDYVSFENPFINPEWTKPDLAPSLLTPYIATADEMIGVEKTNHCLLELGMDRSYFANQSNWVSIEFFDELIDYASKYCDIIEFQRRSGEKLASKGFLEANCALLGILCSPNIPFNNADRFLPRFNKTRTYTYKKLSHVSGLFQVGLAEGRKLPKESHSCENWKAGLEAYIKLMTGSPGKVRKLTCCYSGDESCNYKIEWYPTRYKRLIIFLVSTVIFLFAWPFLQNGSLIIFFVLGGGLFCKLLYSLKTERDTLIKELNLQEENSLQKYNELQDSKNKAYDMYHEAKIISEVTSRIHSFEKVENILTPTLKDICIKLKYDRAFVMLSDDSKKYLKTKAAYGLRGDGLKIWNYKVNLKSKAETMKFISTTFRTGKSLLLTDFESRYSELNDESKSLVDMFQPENVCIISMKANDESVGVLVVERKRAVGAISRRDLTLLERISQTLGLSIEKERRYERESLLRKSFQKFVPTKLVEDFLDKKTDVLKGEKKNISVAFVDIRGFTELTSEMAPEKLVYFLNKFYSIANTAAKNTGGIIDKLLGDGVLVLWGVHGEYSDKESRALEFFDRLKEGLIFINDESFDFDFPELKIGVGMSSGEAIVGTLGDDIKMEYTAVGPVVNLASRLEELCKVHRVECVVSLEFLDELEESKWDRFDVFEEKYISGVGHNVKVGMIK